MISPEEIRKKAERYYVTVLINFILNESSFPWDIAVGKVLPEDLLQYSEPLRILEKGSKTENGSGYRLLSSKKETRKFGAQTLPQRIVFDTQTDFLFYLDKVREFEEFRKSANLILEKIPDLREWILSYPLKVSEHAGRWNELLEVCEYFRKNPRPGLYIRELPVRVPTKFIEENKTVLRELLDFLIPSEVRSDTPVFEDRFGLKKAEDLIRFRILDSEIAENGFSGLTDLSVPVQEFRSIRLENCNIVFLFENKTNFSNIYNFLTLPLLRGAIAIFGKGWGVGSLKSCEWLKSKRLLYWGDLDVQGFEILSSLRETFPETESFLMDRNTFFTFQEFAIDGVPSRVSDLSFLNEEERATWEFLRSLERRNRLEQEKIPNWFVKNCLNSIFDF
ncbi:Wadjet anti-phage system protein JetD domain-containing protein [Leptospira alexanderi]|uniref:Wadjet anti-phage system protein JetD domain-containing protein n=1 Tax=Leptospira alexanderi TaxID=100053 RepID=UPI000990A61F|nr:Wadjet anti-phage system protein JetD domain-containing protein [Leptospira alexanderi]